MMMAMKKSIPPRLPKKDTNQEMSTSLMEMRRCKKAVVMNMMFDVKRSAPVRTIMTRPMGNMRAPMVLIRPGACS